MRSRDGRGRLTRRRPGVEGLEGRRLLAVSITEYPVPEGMSVYYLAGGPDGRLWFLGNEINLNGGAFEPATGHFFSVQRYFVGNGLISGPGDAIWFSGGGIDRVDTHTMGLTQIFTSDSTRDLCEGPDGNIWFTDGDKIGMLDPVTRGISEFDVPTAMAWSRAITAGPDGRLWFAEYEVDKIGAIDPSTHAIVEYDLPTPGSGMQFIKAGPDGALWFTETRGNRIGRIDPKTGVIAEYPIPTASSGVENIVVGPDGNLWFAEYSVGKLGVINPKTHAISEVSLPDTGSEPFDLTIGPDGALWFTELAAGKLGRLQIVPGTVSGTISLPRGPDGAVLANDSRLADRTVYLDLNGDGRLEPGEPTATTDASGHYALSTTVVGTYPLGVVTRPGEAWDPVSAKMTGYQASPTVADLTLIPGSPVLPLTPDPTPFGDHPPDAETAEATALYRLILGRGPDAPGLATWVGLLKSRTPLSQVASDFLESTEYESRAVASYYREFLSRVGSAQEVAAWVSVIQGGWSFEQVAQGFLGSREFAASHPDDASFARALYVDTLGRAGTDGEVAAWASSMASGLDRASVVRGFLESTEAETRAVEGFYETLLPGTVSPSSVTAYVEGLQQGATLVATASAIASSLESEAEGQFG